MRRLPDRPLLSDWNLSLPVCPLPVFPPPGSERLLFTLRCTRTALLEMTSPGQAWAPCFPPAALNAATPAFLHCCSHILFSSPARGPWRAGSPPHLSLFPRGALHLAAILSMLVEVLKLAIPCAQPCSGSQGACDRRWPPWAHRAAGDLSPPRSAVLGVPATTAGWAQDELSLRLQSASHACWWPEMAGNFLSSFPAPQSSASLAVPSFHHFHPSPNSWSWGTQVPPSCPHFCLLIHTPDPVLNLIFLSLKYSLWLIQASSPAYSTGNYGCNSPLSTSLLFSTDQILPTAGPALVSLLREVSDKELSL